MTTTGVKMFSTKQTRFFLFCFLMLNSMLFATSRPLPCQFSVTGEWLCLNPIVDNTAYVIDNAIEGVLIGFPQIGPRKEHELDYHSGFRVQGMYALSDCYRDIRFAWAHLDVNDTASVSGPFLHPTKGYHQFTVGEYSGSAISKIDFDFDRVELLFGHRFINCYGLEAILEAGLQYAKIETKQHITYAPTRGFDHIVNTDSRYWGVGPQIGLNLAYDVFSCFSVVGVANGALLVGNSEMRNVIGDRTAITVDTKSDDIRRLVPSFQMRAGLNYSFCLACFTFDFEGGYEFLAYLHPLANSIGWFNNFGPNDLPGSSAEYYSNTHLHGPYLSVTLAF